MINLKNKKILIMGASGFIGEETAITLSKIGAKLVISGKNRQKLEKVMYKLEGTGHKALNLDIGQINKIEDFIKKAVEYDGEKLSGLVYCTGIYPLRPLKSSKYSFLHEVMMINYFALIELVRCFSQKKICSEGTIVILSSYASINGDKGQLAYSASKGAIDSSIPIIAKELYNKNIRINAIRPASLLKEDIDLYSLPKGIIKSIEDMKTGPIKPENIAQQIAFLLSEASSGVTGRCFDVRGYLS